MSRNWLARMIRAIVKAGQTVKSVMPMTMMVAILAGCIQPAPTPRLGAIYREETVVLPTGAPTPEPSPPSTRVVPEVFTPGSPATITPIPDEVRALVVEVIDGDTITVVMEGDSPNQSYQVRYLGIDVPPNTPSAPWGVVAYETNRKLTNLKVVRLERDQTDFDEEGHLLRYVYVDNQLLSILLAEQGLARANIVEPDTRFEAEVLEAEARARQGNLGLWGSPPTPTPGISEPPGTEQAGTPPAETPTPDASPTRANVTTTPEETDEAEPTPQSTTENEAGNELQGPE